MQKFSQYLVFVFAVCVQFIFFSTATDLDNVLWIVSPDRVSPAEPIEFHIGFPLSSSGQEVDYEFFKDQYRLYIKSLVGKGYKLKQEGESTDDLEKQLKWGEFTAKSVDVKQFLDERPELVESFESKNVASLIQFRMQLRNLLSFLIINKFSFALRDKPRFDNIHDRMKSISPPLKLSQRQFDKNFVIDVCDKICNTCTARAKSSTRPYFEAAYDKGSVAAVAVGDQMYRAGVAGAKVMNDLGATLGPYTEKGLYVVSACSDYVKTGATRLGHSAYEISCSAIECSIDYSKNAALTVGQYAKTAALTTGQYSKAAALTAGQYAKNAALTTGQYSKAAALNTGHYAKTAAIATGDAIKGGAEAAYPYVKSGAEAVCKGAYCAAETAAPYVKSGLEHAGKGAYAAGQYIGETAYPLAKAGLEYSCQGAECAAKYAAEKAAAARRVMAEGYVAAGRAAYDAACVGAQCAYENGKIAAQYAGQAAVDGSVAAGRFAYDAYENAYPYMKSGYESACVGAHCAYEKTKGAADVAGRAAYDAYENAYPYMKSGYESACVGAHCAYEKTKGAAVVAGQAVVDGSAAVGRAASNAYETAYPYMKAGYDAACVGAQCAYESGKGASKYTAEKAAVAGRAVYNAYETTYPYMKAGYDAACIGAHCAYQKTKDAAITAGTAIKNGGVSGYDVACYGAECMKKGAIAVGNAAAKGAEMMGPYAAAGAKQLGRVICNLGGCLARSSVEILKFVSSGARSFGDYAVGVLKALKVGACNTNECALKKFKYMSKKMEAARNSPEFQNAKSACINAGRDWAKSAYTIYDAESMALRGYAVGVCAVDSAKIIGNSCAMSACYFTEFWKAQPNEEHEHSD